MTFIYETSIIQERRQSTAKPQMSKEYEDVPLMDEHKQVLYTYAYYVHLRLHAPWRVPILYGRLPRLPDPKAPAYEKATYALFIMMLFRPHRSLADIAEFAFGGHHFQGSIEDAWQAIFQEYEQWRTRIHETAAKK